MKKLICVALAICLLLCSCGSKTGSGEGGTLMFVTGKSGGTYYSLGTSMATIWDKYSKSTTNIISSAGSKENITMLTKGDADFGFVQSDILYYAQNGKELYEDLPQKGISVVATLYQEAVQIVVNAGSDLQNVSDLVGRTVAVGEYGSATEAAARQILEACGVSYDSITVKYQTFSQASGSLATGGVDAIFAVSCLPSANISEYAETHSIRFLPVSTSNASKLRKSCPFFRDGAILDEAYGTENSVSTVCIDVLLVCRSALSDDAVYFVTSSLFGNLDELVSAHARGADISLEGASTTKVGSIHNGAKKYYAELA